MLDLDLNEASDHVDHIIALSYIICSVVSRLPLIAIITPTNKTFTECLH